MSTTTSTTTQRGTRGLAWAVLVAAVLQVVAPVVTVNGPGASPGQGSGPELLITPVGWAFSIWGVIYALAIAQAISVLVAGADGVSRRLQVGQLALYLGGAVWIVVAGFESGVATALVLALMLVAAVVALLAVARESASPRWLGILTRASVGLYAGWVTAAFFLNLSTALAEAGPFDADQLTWQLVVLGVAAVTLLALLVRTRGIVAYAAAGTWAMIGIAVTGNADGTSEVVLVALAAAAVLVVATAALNLGGSRSLAV